LLQYQTITDWAVCIVTSTIFQTFTIDNLTIFLAKRATKHDVQNRYMCTCCFNTIINQFVPVIVFIYTNKNVSIRNVVNASMRFVHDLQGTEYYLDNTLLTHYLIRFRDNKKIPSDISTDRDVNLENPLARQYGRIKYALEGRKGINGSCSTRVLLLRAMSLRMRMDTSCVRHWNKSFTKTLQTVTSHRRDVVTGSAPRRVSDVFRYASRSSAYRKDVKFKRNKRTKTRC
jgi:hypothetical protein